MATIEQLVAKLGATELEGMNAADLLSALKKVQSEEKRGTSFSKAPLTAPLQEKMTQRAPAGPFPGKGRQAQTAGTPKTSAEKDRARRFGFPAAKILVLVDGSEESDKAIDAALHYRRRNDAIIFAHAVKLLDPQHTQANLEASNKGKVVIDNIRERIAEREIGRWEVNLIPSNQPQQAVLAYANENNVDLIFIGTRGVNPQTHQFYDDSMAKFIIENSPCSAMLVR